MKIEIQNPVLVNVRDFGAFGDGIHDDTVAIDYTKRVAQMIGQHALVHFPTGIYVYEGNADGFQGETNSRAKKNE